MKLASTTPLLIALATASAAPSFAAPSFASESSRTTFRPLEFTSRAECAIQSSSPTRSIFIVGDGHDAGRLAFNLKTKLNAAVTESESMTAFRRSVAFTFKTVVEKVLRGELPLLIGPGSDPTMADLFKSCEKQRGCRQLETKLNELWSKNSFSALSPMPSTAASRKVPAPLVGCHKVSKFGALHGHLNKTRPLRSDLQGIAESLISLSDTANSSPSATGLESCDAPDSENSSFPRESLSSDRHFLIQLDLVSSEFGTLLGGLPFELSFESQGFHFWSSVKTYAAWAWRKAPEVQASMGRFAKFFPGLTLEEQVLIVPNGCRSVSLPKCELQRLSLDAIRELAKAPGVLSGFERNVPDGPQVDLIQRGTRGVNDGFLGTKASDAQAWVKNFISRFNEARWASRNKLQGALRQARWLEKIPVASLIKDIDSDLTIFNAAKNEALASQMAAICLESRLLEDPTLRILRPDFENILAAGLRDGSTREQLQSLTRSALELARGLRPLCDSLERSLFASSSKKTEADRTFHWKYLSDWSRERLGPIVESNQSDAASGVAKKTGWPRPTPYLELSNATGSSAIEICRSPLSCAQLVFKSYVDVYFVATWSSAFQSARKLKDSNLFNPYSELTACKVYDPWFATAQANADLTQRLLVSAITSPLPVPIFFESSKKRPQVVKLNPITGADAQDLRFETEYADEPSKKTFFTDLGPLTGAPCAVQYSNEAGAPFQVYGISGVTLNFCSDGRTGNADADDGGSTKKSGAKYSVCGGCTVNATSAVSVVSYAAPPGPLRFLFGAMRAFGLYSETLSDSVNRPVSYKVNPGYVVDTFNENQSTIPERCTNSLSRGYRCYSDVCAAHAAHIFETRSGIRPSQSSIQYDGDSDLNGSGGVSRGTQTGVVGIRAPGCDSEILAQVRCDQEKNKYELLTDFSSFSSACRPVLNRANTRSVNGAQP